MSYLGKYRDASKSVGVKAKMLDKLKLVPDYQKRSKELAFKVHVARLVQTKCPHAHDQNDVVVAVFQDLFGNGFLPADKEILIENLEYLRSEGRITKYTRFERVFEYLYDIFRLVR